MEILFVWVFDKLYDKNSYLVILEIIIRFTFPGSWFVCVVLYDSFNFKKPQY